jgi:hypothetical protein
VFATVGVPLFIIGISVFSVFMAMRQTDHTLKVRSSMTPAGLQPPWRYVR